MRDNCPGCKGLVCRSASLRTQMLRNRWDGFFRGGGAGKDRKWAMWAVGVQSVLGEEGDGYRHWEGQSEPREQRCSLTRASCGLGAGNKTGRVPSNSAPEDSEPLC